MRTCMKKKILYLVTKSNWGGAQRYVYDLATNLPKNRFDAAVACGGKGELIRRLSDAHVPVMEIPNLERDIALVKEVRALLSIMDVIRVARPDILHVNSSKAGGLGALAGRIMGVKKIIFTVHGWPFKEERNVFVQTLFYFASWMTSLLSDVVIVVSQEDERLGKRMWFTGGKIIYIPLARIPSEMFTRKQAEEILFTGPATSFLKAVRLVTIAELTPNKGLRYGIDMMKELEKRAPGTYTYMIFGKGEEESFLTGEVQAKNLASAVSFANINPPIHLLQADFSSEASRYLRAFDIFILPSIKEGMPYVLLEAAAAGLPIVATESVQSETGDFSEIRIVPSKNGKALASAIQEIATTMPNAKPRNTPRSFEAFLEKTLTVYQ